MLLLLFKIQNYSCKSCHKLFFLLGVISLWACSPTPKPKISFYTWKSSPDLGTKEIDVFNKTNAQTLYIRIFDVDKKQATPQPQALLQGFDPHKINAQFAPVIFITNRVFKGLSSTQLNRLEEHVLQLTTRLTNRFNMTYNEIQIDCDWTQTTQATYFQFLKDLRQLSDKKITCTLRLHQVKYRSKTGVPPVKKVYLMCYATSNPLKSPHKNSILDLALLKNYLQTINTYPLHFDIALPLYSWAIVTNHLGRKKLVNGVSKTGLRHNKHVRENKNGGFTASTNFFLRGLYVNKNFHIKVEGISPQLLQKTRNYLRQKIERPYNIVYYHLDRTFTDRFTIKSLQ